MYILDTCAEVLDLSSTFGMSGFGWKHCHVIALFSKDLFGRGEQGSAYWSLYFMFGDRHG